MIELQYTIRFILQIGYFLALLYVFQWSIPTTLKDWRAGSLALALVFGTLTCYVGTLSLVSPLNLFFLNERDTWLVYFLVAVNLTLIACILAVLWIIRLRHNAKISASFRLLRTSEDDLEVELATTRQAVERQTRRLEDSRHFLQAVAHDLRAPLRAVSGFIELIREEADQPPNPDYLQQVEYGAAKMMRLIDDLSILSRIENEQAGPERVDLNQVMTEVLRTFQAEIDEKRIEVGPLAVVKGIELRLVQLFQNLVGNALKFGATRIQIEAKTRGKDVTVSVRDNGIGIAKAYQTKIFEPFQRLNREEDYEGTGMGLAICHRIVALHQGAIWVESEQGEGSTFFVRLHRG